MPKDVETSVRLLRNFPLEFYNSLHPRIINDVFDSPSCTIGQYKRADGETKARAVMCVMLNETIDQFNVGKTMDVNQVAKCADAILEDYGFLKIDDFKLCFKMAIKGDFGKSYDRLDVQVILGWLDAYLTLRMNEADTIGFGNHSGIKAGERYAPSFMEIALKHGK